MKTNAANKKRSQPWQKFDAEIARRIARDRADKAKADAAIAQAEAKFASGELRPATKAEAATMLAEAHRARAALSAGDRRSYRLHCKAIADVAKPTGARVIEHGDLLGMVVGLEFPDSSGARNWIFLA